jgi:hypothetical protein
VKVELKFWFCFFCRGNRHWFGHVRCWHSRGCFTRLGHRRYRRRRRGIGRHHQRFFNGWCRWRWRSGPGGGCCRRRYDHRSLFFVKAELKFRFFPGFFRRGSCGAGRNGRLVRYGCRLGWRSRCGRDWGSWRRIVMKFEFMNWRNCGRCSRNRRGGRRLVRRSFSGGGSFSDGSRFFRNRCRLGWRSGRCRGWRSRRRSLAKLEFNHWPGRGRCRSRRLIRLERRRFVTHESPT